MSRNRPTPPKPFVSNVSAAAGVATCGDCKHWKPTGVAQLGFGHCTERPPALVAKVTSYGPLCCYPLTMTDTPACGRAEAK